MRYRGYEFPGREDIRSMVGRAMAGWGLALQLAVEAHAGQKDKGGEACVFHPIRVMMKCRGRFARMAALLHDVVEVSPVTMEDLAREGFPGEVLEAVRLLMLPADVPYEACVDAVRGHAIAREVELADPEGDWGIRRLRQVEEYAISRLREDLGAYDRLQDGSPR